MALLQSELDRIKAETGWNLLDVGALPYIGVTSLFEQIIGPNLRAGAVTSSSTGVTASPGGAALVALTLASAAGFSAGARVVVDVDDRQETVTLESISGLAASMLLSNAHSGTYPVTVEGGESIVREYLANIRNVKTQMAQAFGAGSLKAVDEVQFYDTKGRTLFGVLGEQLAFWRDELASALGIASMWRRNGGGSTRLSVY